MARNTPQKPVDSPVPGEVTEVVPTPLPKEEKPAETLTEGRQATLAECVAMMQKQDAAARKAKR